MVNYILLNHVWIHYNILNESHIRVNLSINFNNIMLFLKYTIFFIMNLQSFKKVLEKK